MTKKLRKLQGNVLILVMLVMLIGVFAVAMAASLVITSSQTQGARLESSTLRSAAESGVENAILSQLRNPAYTGGNVVVDGVTVNTVVTPGTTSVPTIIVATASSSNQRHVYRVTVDRIDGTLTVTSWKQIE